MIKRDARAHILETADRLFYAEGVRAVGIDRLIGSADVAKATFYKHFPSKEALVVAYVELRLMRLISWLDATLNEHFRDVKARPLAAIGLLTHRFRAGDDRGCPFTAVLAEYKAAGDPVRVAAARAKDSLRAWLEDHLIAAGLERDARSLSWELMIIYDGAIELNVRDRSIDAGQRAMDMTRRLLSQIG